MKKEIVYYTCNTHRLDIEYACRDQLVKSGLPIVSVSREKPIEFGDTRVVVHGERSPLTMHYQVLAGLNNSFADVVFLCESDVLYHPSHFAFQPSDHRVFYYNTNVWKIRFDDGHCVWTDNLQQVSGICAYRRLLIDFYEARIEKISRDGFDNHYEPGHKVGPYKTENYFSAVPNVDIRHDNTITRSKWSVDDFRNKKYAEGWKESEVVPMWGRGVDIISLVKSYSAEG